MPLKLTVSLFSGCPVLCLVESGNAEWLDSSEYAVGGYCEEASAMPGDREYRKLTHVVSEDICDMCGQLLPPAHADDDLRQKHIRVRLFVSYF